MSRASQLKTSPISKRDSRMGGGSTQDGELHKRLDRMAIGDANSITNLQRSEICPVCKSSRYLNSNLRFLVNPECYHKMCESCVDRIFSHGPARCPIPGCQKTLRKPRFREQTFEDIKVEREVDIRKKVAAVFNRREDEFETLRAYNDYLNDVEDITFNLINNIDLEETNKRFDAYQKAHEKEIIENAQRAQQETQSFAAMQKAERQLAKQRREAARREEEEEKREMEETRRDMLNRLASGQDADLVARQGQQVQLKKRMDRQAAAERQRQLQAASSGIMLIKGLKSKQKVEPEAPIDPFGGVTFGMQYFTLQDDYIWEGVQDPKTNVQFGAGGYNVNEFTTRALCDAFAGLGVFVDDHDKATEKAPQSAEVGGVKGPAVAASDVKMEDPL
ncbi:rna polymerase ii transcription factor b subunit 3 [Acrodontium crateriforme]|uniref:RNA polymerase II transcription factor B subunit 3 n=1 Tax=Acrodontium crateriforme TaxID=150365 RepID=A0AAQ3M7Y7_9PEZI|nr:rna polymerase ii transcription factor b subunit 3 [Acrodontium crateriforme]